MAKQGIFTLPANISFGVTAYANSQYTETLTVLVDGVSKGTFSGTGANEVSLGHKVFNSGKGAIQVTVSAHGSASDLVSTQVVLGGKANFALLASEDGGDGDYNDCVAILNWAIG
jgi:hypothetical protein